LAAVPKSNEALRLPAVITSEAIAPIAEQIKQLILLL
jgi:hypothetical protein